MKGSEHAHKPLSKLEETVTELPLCCQASPGPTNCGFVCLDVCVSDCHLNKVNKCKHTFGREHAEQSPAYLYLSITTQKGRKRRTYACMYASPATYIFVYKQPYRCA